MSFLGALGRLLPGYMQGERQAIQDNWNDLNQYNKVQAGQLQNMFDENVMQDRMNMVKDNAMINNFQRHAAGIDLGYKYAQMPLAYWQLGQQTAYAPLMSMMKYNMLGQLYGGAMGGGPLSGGLLQQAALGGMPQSGLLGGGLGYGGYGLGGRGGSRRTPSRLF